MLTINEPGQPVVAFVDGAGINATLRAIAAGEYKLTFYASPYGQAMDVFTTGSERLGAPSDGLAIRKMLTIIENRLDEQREILIRAEAQWLEHFMDDSQPNCTDCNGTGKISSETNCDWCGGTGDRNFAFNDRDWIDCDWCEGTGKEWEFCASCKGTGKQL